DPHTALLAAFRNKETGPAPSNQPAREKDVALVRLLELTASMRRTYLAGKDVSDQERFQRALERKGLAPLALRPGDLNILIDYWEDHGDFASLREMMEFKVDRGLRERDQR